MHGKLILAALGIGLALTLGWTAGEIESVTIGKQVWMKKNLDVEVAGSSCYKNDSANCKKYGRLYTWATAMALPDSCNINECADQVQAKHRGVCPSGWHIPSNAEWDVLYKFVDNSYDVKDYYSKTAGKHLKAKSGWNSDGNGEDTYGFAALPGGYGDLDGSFYSVGEAGYWWSASEFGTNGAYYLDMSYSYGGAYWSYNVKVDNWFSVRCVRDLS